MTNLIKSCDDKFIKLAESEGKDCVFRYIRECNGKNNFPTEMEIDSVIYSNYKTRVENPLELSSLARHVLKKEGNVIQKVREDHILGYAITDKK